MHLLIVEYLSFSVALTSIYPMFKKKKLQCTETHTCKCIRKHLLISYTHATRSLTTLYETQTVNHVQ